MFFNQIPIELLKIYNLNAMHLSKKFLAAIFSTILYLSAVPMSTKTIREFKILKIP